MAYAFWMWLRIKVLGFLDNSVTVQRLSDPWNINWGRTPAKYHLLTGHLSSSWKVTLQTFVLRVLIPDGPDTPGFAQSPWQDRTSLSSSREGEMGPVLGVWKCHLGQMGSCCVFPLPGPRVSQLGPPPHGPTGCRVMRHGLPLTPGAHRQLSWQQSRPSSAFPCSSSDEPRAWECRTRKPGGSAQSNQSSLTLKTFKDHRF